MSGGYFTYQTNNYVIDNVTLNDSTGTFTVSGSITDAALFAEMSADQSLSFSLGVWGDLVLSNATLTLDINNTVAAVPEPSTFALAVAGLALVLAVARRRRSRAQGASRNPPSLREEVGFAGRSRSPGAARSPVRTAAGTQCRRRLAQ